MTGKDFLHKVWVAQMCYKEVKTEYHCVCEDVESLRAIDYSTPVSNGRRKDFADIVVKLEEKKIHSMKKRNSGRTLVISAL